MTWVPMQVSMREDLGSDIFPRIKRQWCWRWKNDRCFLGPAGEKNGIIKRSSLGLHRSGNTQREFLKGTSPSICHHVLTAAVTENTRPGSSHLLDTNIITRELQVAGTYGYVFKDESTNEPTSQALPTYWSQGVGQKETVIVYSCRSLFMQLGDVNHIQ